MISQNDCPDCFNEQRSINDQLQQTIIDAQKFANTEKKNVAVFQQGRKYDFAVINGAIPGATVKVIQPVQ